MNLKWKKIEKDNQSKRSIYDFFFKKRQKMMDGEGIKKLGENS